MPIFLLFHQLYFPLLFQNRVCDILNVLIFPHYKASGYFSDFPSMTNSMHCLNSHVSPPVLQSMMRSFSFVVCCPLTRICAFTLNDVQNVLVETYLPFSTLQASIIHTWILSVAPLMVPPLAFSPLSNPSYLPRLIFLKCCVYCTQPLEAPCWPAG